VIAQAAVGSKLVYLAPTWWWPCEIVNRVVNQLNCTVLRMHVSSWFCLAALWLTMLTREGVLNTHSSSAAKFLKLEVLLLLACKAGRRWLSGSLVASLCGLALHTVTCVTRFICVYLPSSSFHALYLALKCLILHSFFLLVYSRRGSGCGTCSTRGICDITCSVATDHGH
jgi:hypothetical protein